jgi:hypothetical protein
MKTIAAIFPVRLSRFNGTIINCGSDNEYTYNNACLFLHSGTVFSVDKFDGIDKCVQKSIPGTILFDGVHYSNSDFAAIFSSLNMDYFQINFR